MNIASLFDSACGVSRESFVDDPEGPAIVARCSRLESRIGAAMLFAVAVLLLALSCVKSSQTQKPVVPAWSSAIPAAIGLLYLWVWPFVAKRSFLVDIDSYARSGMNKKEWMAQTFANQRAHITASATLQSGGLIAGSLASSNGQRS